MYSWLLNPLYFIHVLPDINPADIDQQFGFILHTHASNLTAILQKCFIISPLLCSTPSPLATNTFAIHW